MTMSPGQLRQFAAVARRDVIDYRQWAHEATDPVKKRRYEKWADDREEYAEFYDNLAGRGEIVVEYSIINERMAAE